MKAQFNPINSENLNFLIYNDKGEKLDILDGFLKICDEIFKSSFFYFWN